MDARSIQLLEFPLIRERLAEATSFPPSRRLAEGLEPETDAVLIDPIAASTRRSRSASS
jgi:hypothetical protein